MTNLDRLKRCSGKLHIAHIDGIAWASDGWAMIRLPEMEPETGPRVAEAMKSILEKCTPEFGSPAKLGGLVRPARTPHANLLREVTDGKVTEYFREMLVQLLDGELYLRRGSGEQHLNASGRFAEIWSVRDGVATGAAMGTETKGDTLLPVCESEGELEYYRDCVLYGIREDDND